jgi:hypothetical protein
MGIAAVSVAGACASGLRSAASFSGRPRPALVSAEQVREVAALPAGYEALGEVTATCRVTQGRRQVEGEWLSDVDCGPTRLVAALRERAAQVGGELLVARRCSSQLHRRAQRQTDVSCRGQVARPTPRTQSRRPLEPRPGGQNHAASSGVSAGEIWQVLVDFSPNPETAPRPDVYGPEAVRELAQLPVSHVPLGDVVTRCARGCSEAAARSGVRIVAGRMGATDVVDVHCVRRDAGFICTGTAAAYEVDPGRDVRVR